MFTGRIVGEIWATKKVPSLQGLRLLLVEPEVYHPPHLRPHSTKDLVVAADVIGAGVGERVIVAYGHGARNALGRGENVAVEAAVVGIVDDVELTGGGV
ncbi:MAG: ethanolamine utilization protein EutN [Planctomycetota bacterium]|nr:MAG: ethanolamine utilization protein EutN [Planctomycetota bacterium]